MRLLCEGGVRRAQLLARRRPGARVVAFLASAPPAWPAPEAVAAAARGLGGGGVDIIALAPEDELGPEALAGLRALVAGADAGRSEEAARPEEVAGYAREGRRRALSAAQGTVRSGGGASAGGEGLEGGNVGDDGLGAALAPGGRRPSRLVVLPAPAVGLDARQQLELLLEALDAPARGPARLRSPPQSPPWRRPAGAPDAFADAGAAPSAAAACQVAWGPAAREAAGAAGAPACGPAQVGEAAAAYAQPAPPLDGAGEAAASAVPAAGLARVGLEPQTADAAQAGSSRPARTAADAPEREAAAGWPPPGAPAGRACAAQLPAIGAPAAAGAAAAASLRAAGALPALLRRHAGVFAPARCRDESLDALRHLSSDGFMRPWLPSYAAPPARLRPGGGGGGSGGSGGGGQRAGAGGAERLCYVLVYRLDLPKWRVLAVRAPAS